MRSVSSEIEETVELYLRDCYRQRTVARVSELAELLGSNRTYLSRLVRQVLGEPLSTAMRKRQLSHAKRLLCETDLPIEDIAFAAAFGTARTFFRAFARAYGMTPGAYREKATKCL